MNDVATDQIPLELWSKMTNTQFRVRDEQPVLITLTTVTQAPEQVTRPGAAPGPKTESFSLLFRGPTRPALAQGIYTLEHEQLGRFHLFLVPIGRTSNECDYEAVFNRLAGSPGRVEELKLPDLCRYQAAIP